MADLDIIVVGASSGGMEALPQLVAGLPRELQAAVLVVQHVSPQGPNWLARRLNAASPLHAASAIDGEPLRPGHIHVAMPDHHLMIEDGHIRLTRGPRENFSRPAIDVLFRSAAYACADRVIGVLLTGRLDDGTAGLWAIKDRGGTAIVQDPQDASYPSMPQSALRYVDADYTLPLREIPARLKSLTNQRPHPHRVDSKPDDPLTIETKIATGIDALEAGVRSLGTPSFQTCPECHGSMVGIRTGQMRRFRCHTGHAFTADALADGARRYIEDSLWSALAQLEQYRILLRETPEPDPNLVRRTEEVQTVIARVRQLAMDPTLGPEEE